MPLLAFVSGGGDADEVLEELAASLLLENEGDLDGTVEEAGDDLDIVLEHVTGGDGCGTEADTTGNLSRGVAGDSVLCTTQ